MVFAPRPDRAVVSAPPSAAARGRLEAPLEHRNCLLIDVEHAPLFDVVGEVGRFIDLPDRAFDAGQEIARRVGIEKWLPGHFDIDRARVTEEWLAEFVE